MKVDDLVTVYTLTDPNKAEIVKNALQSEGVSCVLDGIHQAADLGLMAFEIKVKVRAGDADRAQRFIALHEAHHRS
ncbi:MAG: DUF2007 domain-containing protein [Gemmataceae bacterium]|nr:DUF2007 domain-containing protein [Gemmataceae bacterium]